MGIEQHDLVPNGGKEMFDLVIHEGVIGGEQFHQQRSQGGNVPLALSQLKDPAVLCLRRLDLEMVVEGLIRVYNAQVIIQNEEWLADRLHNRVREVSRILQLRVALLKFCVHDEQL